MNVLERVSAWVKGEPQGKRVVEAAASQAQPGNQSREEPGFSRITGGGTASGRDLSPLKQERMQRLAEFLWESNLLANRLVELPLAYLLAEGVTLTCNDPEHQKLLDGFWNDPINNWPLKLAPRVRALGLLGEQCYILHVNEGSGFVRLGYLDPRQIATVVQDPDNPEQAIGVITRKDSRGRSYKYRVALLAPDDQLFSQRTCEIRKEAFTDGECMLFQVNKFPDGTRGRSDLLGQMDWLDAYDQFLFDELDRIGYLRSFVWDVTLTGMDPAGVEEFDKKFKPPEPNSKFVHNDGVKLQAINPSLQSADTSESARLLRNHVLGGATVPEHWFGGGGDVNRAAAGEMGEPTFKVYTMRQSVLKLMLEDIGRMVLWKATGTGEPNWADESWKVTAKFPELANKDITKFATAMQTVVTSVISMIDGGLLTEETGLGLIADVAARFGARIDPKVELTRARAEAAKRSKTRAAEDSFNLDADTRDALSRGDAQPIPELVE
jgi:hypothetical protein